MSKSQKTLYLNDTFNLIRTLVIKNNLTAEAINRELSILGYQVDSNPKSWKYYLNLSGQYHESDVPMTITSIDTLETIDFTLTELSQHRATALEIKERGDMYRDLVNRFPNQTSLIDGIINPVDIDEAIAVKDWTILTYDHTLVESQETNLIFKLQEWVYAFNNRWLNPDYALIEDLYPASHLAVMYSQLPGVLLGIRLENCRSGFTHSFHIWSYLDQFHELAEFRRALSIKQALFLYRNIDMISAESYTDETFKLLVDKLLTERGIPLYGYHLQHDATNVGEHNGSEMYRYPINFLDVESTTDSTRTIRSVLTDGLNLTKRNHETLEHDIVNTTDMMNASDSNRRITKVIESDIRDDSDKVGIDLDYLLLTQWLDMADTIVSGQQAGNAATSFKYRTRISIEDPSSDSNITLDAREAWILVLWLIAKSEGYDITEVPTITDYSALKRELPQLEYLKLFSHNTNVSDEILKHISNPPTVGIVVSAITFRQYVIELREFMIEQKFQIGVQEALPDHMAVQFAVDSLYESRDYKFTDLSYAQWFTAKGINLESISENEAKTMSLSIIDSFTGNVGVKQLSTFQTQQSLLEIVKRLANYDIQYLHKVSESPSVLATNKTFRINNIEGRVSSKVNILDTLVDAMDAKLQTYLHCSSRETPFEVDTYFMTSGKVSIDLTVNTITKSHIQRDAICALPVLTAKLINNESAPE